MSIDATTKKERNNSYYVRLNSPKFRYCFGGVSVHRTVACTGPSRTVRAKQPLIRNLPPCALTVQHGAKTLHLTSTLLYYTNFIILIACHSSSYAQIAFAFPRLYYPCTKRSLAKRRHQRKTEDMVLDNDTRGWIMTAVSGIGMAACMNLNSES
jgi:hypothetical protein